MSGVEMRTCVVDPIKKTFTYKGSIAWNELKDVQVEKADLRFCLYVKGEDSNGKINYNSTAFFFDVDNTTLLEGSVLVKAIKESLPGKRFYHLFTGGGHHFYFPVEQLITDECFNVYKKSYLSLVKKLEHLTELAFDPVFRRMQLGRVPGSYNSRRKRRVIFLGEHGEKTIQNLSEVFKSSPVTKTQEVILDRQLSERVKGEEVIYEQCGFIQYCHQNVVDLSGPKWIKAMGILAGRGNQELAHHISKDYPNYDPKEVNRFFKDTKYRPFCSTVDHLFDKEPPGSSPCVGCAHNREGNSPVTISGPHPTPSAGDGFHRRKQSGSGKNATWVIDEEKVVTHDVANHWVNCKGDKVLRIDSSLFLYEETSWRVKIESLKDPASFPTDVKDEFYSIPRHTLQGVTQRLKCLQELGMAALPQKNSDEMDNERYINFSNGVYNLEDGKLYDHSKDYYMINTMGTTMKEEQTPVWDRFLEEAIPDKKEQNLLQVFMGLSLSNEPTMNYQQYLWLYGKSGSGKTLISQVISELVGQAKTAYLPQNFLLPRTASEIRCDLKGKGLLLFLDAKFNRGMEEKRKWESFVTNLIGSPMVEYKLLYQDVFHIQPKCTLIVASNDRPLVQGVEEGGARRLRSIYFGQSPQSTDPKLFFKLKEELPGIAWWALEGLKQYKAKGMPSKGENEKSLDLEIEYLSQDDVKSFGDRFIRRSKGTNTLVSTLYTKYCVTTGSNMKEEDFTFRLVTYLTDKFKLPRAGILSYGQKGVRLHGFRFIKPGEEE